jgi:hypothetical protein
MQLKKKIRRSWWLGWIAALACRSLIEDVMGQEAFIASARDHWTPAIYTVPLAIFFLVYSLWTRDTLIEEGE